MLNAYECRGNEYEIQLIWSRSSSKQRILFNDEDTHYFNYHTKNKNDQADRVAKSWKTKLDDDLHAITKLNQKIA